MKKDKKVLVVSIEVLWHFQCGECGKWWSIGDPSLKLRSPRMRLRIKKEWFCPWCGKEQKIAKNK